MPKMGMVMTEGTIVKWQKKVGEHINVGDPILSIETDKMTRDVESKYDGVLAEILCEEGEELPVGTVIARIDDGTPVAAAPTVPSADRKNLSNAQKLVARNLAESCRTMAAASYSASLDRAALIKAAQSCGASELAVLLAAVGKALREHPSFRSSLVDDAVEIRGDVNIGLTLNAGGSLVAPVVRDVDGKSPAQLSEEIAALREKAAEGRLELDDLAGGVFTLTDLSGSGVEFFTPVVNLGDSASLGIGGEYDGVMLSGNKAVVKKLANLCLTADHRLIYSEEAAAFLRAITDTVYGFAQ